MDENHIETEIQKRKFKFYMVTKDELDTLGEKNLFGDISGLFASLSLSALLTGILTKELSQNPTTESIQVLNGIIAVSFGLLTLSLIATLFFKITYRIKTKSIIGEKPVQYSIKEVDKEANPDYYLDNKRIVMNIAVKHKLKFHRLFRSKKEYTKLKTSEHSNNPRGAKKDYFTFIINNGNDNLYAHFQQFLKDSEIEYVDYK